MDVLYPSWARICGVHWTFAGTHSYLVMGQYGGIRMARIDETHAALRIGTLRAWVWRFGFIPGRKKFHRREIDQFFRRMPQNDQVAGEQIGTLLSRLHATATRL